MDWENTRRQFLTISSILFGTAAAGCSGSEVEEDTPASEENETPTQEQTSDEDAPDEGDKNGKSEFDLESSSLRVNRPDIDESILVGEPIQVNATITNTGDSGGTDSINLIVDDTQYTSKDITLDSGESTDIAFDFEFDEPGTTDIRLDDTEVTAVEVTDQIDHERRIGVQYYAWYWGDDGYGGHQLAGDNPEGWLAHTPGEPLLGAYDTRNSEVVNQHIKWSVEHGINWWIVNNGAPDGRIDQTIRNVIFEAELADRIDFTILFGFDPDQQNEDGYYDLDNPELREQLIDRFGHWEETKIDHDSYLYIDGRPTMYFWDSNIYTGDVAEAFDEAKNAIDVDPYIIGGPNYFWQPHRDVGLSEAYDAVKDYHSISTNDEYMDRFRERTVVDQRRWRAATNELGVEFFPTVTPGYDTRAMEGDNPRVQPIERDPTAFAEECAKVRGLADRDTIVVTSFNEWPEHTVIEPSDGEGTTYLDIVSEELARTEWESPSLDYQALTLEFKETIPVDNRELAFQAHELTVWTDEGEITEDVGSMYETFVYLDGMYGPEGNQETSRWFGGKEGVTQLLVDTDTAIEGVTFVGRSPGEPITATVQSQDGVIGTVTFESELATYEVR